jgi:RNA methyltransferase, TrmH family
LSDQFQLVKIYTMLSKSTVKYIQSLTHKKFRDEYGVFTAEGPKVVEELLRDKNFNCKTVCALPEWVKENTQLLNPASCEEVIEINEIELEKISELSTPNKVIGVFYKKEQKEDIDLTGKLTLVLDDIHDPGNMGTIIRIADWFGVENIVCSKSCVDQYNSKVVQGSMGSIGRVNVVYKELVTFLESNSKIRRLFTMLEGKNVKTFGKTEEGLIIIGSESRGIRKEILSLPHEQISIERYGKAESLNAAVATGIILSHLI